MSGASARGRHLRPADRLKRRLAAIPAGWATVAAATIVIGTALPASATDREPAATLQAQDVPCAELRQPDPRA